MLIARDYVWFVWSLTFLVPWLALYWRCTDMRRSMLQASLMTMPLGFTEPIFVPAYWSPPSLFDLAAKTGFDIESLIFSFGIGGIASAAFNVMFRQRNQSVATSERHAKLHRNHYIALSVPFVSFPALYWLPLNPIYTSSLAMLLGAIANVICRPDLKKATLAGGIFFLCYYGVFIVSLAVLFPDYIENVWNLSHLSGRQWFGVPIEEFLFAVTFGMYWSGFYHHFHWLRYRSMEVAGIQ